MGLKLHVTSGPMQGKVFFFDEHDTFLFGRGANVHCQVTGDKAVSRHHFLLEVVPPLARLQDLDSTNGVKVNGILYGERKGGKGKVVDLHNGDVLQVGLTTIEVRVETTQEEVPPTTSSNTAPEIENTGALLENMLRDAAERKGCLAPPEIPGYQIIREIAKGGAGVVYLAKMKATGEEVALKMILAQSGASEHARTRFRKEIEATRVLQHPNIVRLLDAGDVGRTFYLALEFIRGGDLRMHIKNQGGRLGYQESMALILQMLKGMGHAHAQGYVHRDIKPQNILLDQHENRLIAKISDLGLAKNLQQCGLSGFTATNAVAGTVTFMPPEQFTCFKDVSPAADVFSLGATLYMMLTGAYVYNFAKYKDHITCLLEKDTVPIRQRLPTIPAAMEQVIDKATAVEAQDRYPDAGAFREAVKAALHQDPVQP